MVGLGGLVAVRADLVLDLVEDPQAAGDLAR